MRDRAWCVEHDRSTEFVTTDQERVCFSGLGNAETTCRIAALPENECEDCVDWQRESNRAYAMEQAAEARLAQIAELSKAALGTTWTLRDTLRMIEDIARGVEPA